MGLRAGRALIRLKAASLQRRGMRRIPELRLIPMLLSEESVSFVLARGKAAVLG